MLKTNVSGEAEALIADLTIADVNFACAWQRLLDRYDNNRVIVYQHLNKLMIQEMGKTDSKSLKSILDTTDQVLMALKNLGRPVGHWDDWIVLLISSKLSIECRKDWERKVGNTTTLPRWSQLKTFLEEEFRMLEGLENVHRKPASKAPENPKSAKPEVVKSYQSSVEGKKCPSCEGEHLLFQCPKFKGMDVKTRWDLAKRQKLCFSYLKCHKDKLNCENTKPCKKCNKKHSTWLHENQNKAVANAVATTGSNEITSTVGIVTKEAITNAYGSVTEKNNRQVLLTTPLISTQDKFGNKIVLRALIDSGSQGFMITDNAAALLQIKQIPSTKYISGLGVQNTGNVKMIRMVITPRFTSGFNINIECYILKRLTQTLPNQDLCIKSWKHLKRLVLADPTFNKVGN